MGHHKNGMALCMYGREQVQKFLCRSGVQGSCRLIRQDQPGIGDQRPGYCRPLLLASGDFIGIFLQYVCDSQFSGHRKDLCLHFPVMLSFQDQRQINIVPDRKSIQEIKILKDKPQIISSKAGQFLIFQFGDIPSVQEHGTVTGPVQSRQDIQQSRLSGTGFAHHCCVFSVFHSKIYVF